MNQKTFNNSLLISIQIWFILIQFSNNCIINWIIIVIPLIFLTIINTIQWIINKIIDYVNDKYNKT